MIVISCVLAMIINLPFMPGPSVLYAPAQLIYNIATITGGLSVAFLTPVGFIWSIIELRKYPNRKQRAMAIYLCIIPLVIAFSAFTVSDAMRNFSRRMAIMYAAPMIEEIEKYKKETGNYPVKLIRQVKPPIIGIDKYVYELTPHSYKITFYQNVLLSFNFEAVVYNPTYSHKTESELDALYDTGSDHWMYYIYD